MTPAAAIILAAALPAIPQGAGLPYQVPSGWTETRNPATGLIALAPQRLPFGRVARVDVYSPEPFSGTAEAFHREILRRATTGARALEAPRGAAAGEFLATRLHQVMPNGIQLWITIYTARWDDRAQALTFSANTPDMEQRYLAVVDTMVSRIAVPQLAPGPVQPPSAVQTPLAGAVANPTQPPPPPAPAVGGGPVPVPGAASYLDYLYTLPQGWTTSASPGNLLLVSPPSETGERCTIGLWPMAPSSGDLFHDANAAWEQIFREFVVRPGTRAPLIRGVSTQGWEYAVVKREIAWRGTPEPEMHGFVMVAELEDRVATVSWLSKAQLYSACLDVYTGLPEVWPRFFAMLQFKNWTVSSGSGLAQKIPGVWESIGTSTGGGAALQYTFTPANRYAFMGVGQRYMGLSRYETAIWTSTTFGDGSYSVGGNELTLTPDRGEPEVYFIRLEQVSGDGGQTWTEKLYMMRPERTYSLSGSNIRDSEVGLERRNP